MIASTRPSPSVTNDVLIAWLWPLITTWVPGGSLPSRPISLRTAEVTARFTLDAMPGKQMAIDADLNAGLINESQARARREQIAHDAEFYGAMDGAARFNQRDAIATILITAINIVAGFSSIEQFNSAYTTAVDAVNGYICANKQQQRHNDCGRREI